MELTDLKDYLPHLAITAGVILFAWTKKSYVVGYLKNLWPRPKPHCDMSPTKRFDTFYALRTWCEESGYVSSVVALDTEVLPAIVRIEGPVITTDN